MRNMLEDTRKHHRFIMVQPALRTCCAKRDHPVQKQWPGALSMRRQEPAPGLVPGQEPASGQVFFSKAGNHSDFPAAFWGYTRSRSIFLTLLIFLIFPGISVFADEGTKELPEIASGFSITRFDDGRSEITVEDGRTYLVLPADLPLPEEDEGDTEEKIVIRQAPENIYLANSAAGSSFDALDEVGHVHFSGIRREDWTIEAISSAMEAGEILYAGNYSAPDYELLLSAGCDLAVENMMILHQPEGIEKLTELGIPVFIDHASAEAEPLGKTEWIKVYGVLSGKEEEAVRLFEEQKALVDALAGLPNTEKKAASFYVNSQGQIVCPKSGSAFAKMIEMAGGRYVFPDLTDDSSGLVSSIKLGMESFFAAARDADLLIYDNNIAPISSIADLIGKNELFSAFRAVQEGNVWVLGKAVYQNPDKIGSIVRDLHVCLTGEGSTVYLERLS